MSNPRKYVVVCVAMSQWEEQLHARIAARIKKLRGDASAQQLADMTAELGYPVSRSQIANYESRRKKGLDIAELIVLCRALLTSPATLIYPGPYDENEQVDPSATLSRFEAVQWFSGESTVRDEQRMHPSWGGDEAGKSEQRATQHWWHNTMELRLWRELDHAQKMRMNLFIDEDQDRAQVAFYDRQIKRLREQIDQIRAEYPDA
ncbi:helix-turn-helix transcriptional regulator [Mycobacteroides abscessus]|uniref:helix-turn-helix domain-containing protein n=2 Tax=Mycobacteroides abscessus TaxID=36809 RepID=UPI0010568496|nr:helix-turn-helix transcriptional regulator [Mycobacteroides abscessus]MDM1896160.1 helix-turn-helix transcriptional regulator [Mycobacteroides abscessus]MDM1905157.1 helix-turn-helix transcriptional regulator [Mycobacteroides abscessus]MDM1910991.1 helix-turn-helix transcriptional regulator [Mycobacteroides abscessus]MDM1919738.1 helix-turn-helix transcriptional regulator [Mycobacteroides abscessus]MDM2078957.1 helix-turn-helix transcriptional regulator [Mycobacteroides abscessus]